MCWQKTVTARGEASDGDGSNDYSGSVAASRLWADRDHATHFPAGAGRRSQSPLTPAATRVGRGATPLGLSAALSDAAPRGLAGQPQARRAPVSGGRAVPAQTAATQTAESFTHSARAAAGGKPNLGGRFQCAMKATEDEMT